MHNSKEIDLPNLFGSKIIEEAEQLLLDADKDGSVPMFITQNLKKIAQGLGVEITSDQTPEVVINNIREKIKVIQDDAWGPDSPRMVREVSEEKPAISHDEWDGILKIKDEPVIEEHPNNPQDKTWFEDVPKKDTSEEHVVDFAWDDVPNEKTPFESDTEVVDSAETSPSLNTDNKIFKLSPEDRKKLLDASLAATEKASESIGKSKQLLAQLNSTNNEPVLPSSTEQVNVSKITPISEIENVAEKTNIDDAKNKKVAQEESHLKEDAGHTASSAAKLKLGLNTVAGSLLWAKNISNEVNEINTGEKKSVPQTTKENIFVATPNEQPIDNLVFIKNKTPIQKNMSSTPVPQPPYINTNQDFSNPKIEKVTYSNSYTNEPEIDVTDIYKKNLFYKTIPKTLEVDTLKTDTGTAKTKINWKKVQEDFDKETEEINKIRNTREKLQATLPKENTDTPAITPIKIPESVAPVAPKNYSEEKLTINKEIKQHKEILEKSQANLATLIKTEQGIVELLASTSGSLLSKEESDETLKIIRQKRAGHQTLIQKIEEHLTSLQKKLEAIEELEKVPVAPGTPVTPAVSAPQESEKVAFFKKENFSSFDTKIIGQESVSDLAKLLLTEEYKTHTFGRGTRVVTGEEISKRISEKILQAKVGDQLDPYTFIPDQIIASKIHELFISSTEWKEGISEFGTRIFKKENSPIQNPEAQKAMEATLQKIAKKTGPGLFGRVKSWLTRNPVKGAGVVAGGTFLLSKLFAGLLSLHSPQTTNTEEYTQEIKPKETPDQAVNSGASNKLADGSAVDMANGAPVITKVTQKPSTPPTTINAVDPENTSTKQNSVPTTINHTDPDTVVPTIINPVDPDISKIPDNEPIEFFDVDIPVTEPGEIIFDPSSTTRESSIVEAERNIPQSIESSYDLKKRLSEIGLLNEYTRLSVAGLDLTKNLDDEYRKATLGRIRSIEERLDGSPRTSAMWFETFMHQPKTLTLNDKKGINRPALNRAYRQNILAEGEQIRALPNYNLDDNSFFFSNNLYKTFDAWYNNTIKPISQTLENKLTPDEAAYLSNKNITTGEYLARILQLADKYGVQTSVPKVNSATVDRMFESISNQNTVQNVPTYRETFTSFDEQGNARWAVDALNYTENYRVHDSRSLMDWLNGPYYQMVKEWREQESIGTTYTKNELVILKSVFERLSKAIELKTEAAKYDGLIFSGLGTSGANEQREVASIISNIDQKLSQF